MYRPPVSTASENTFVMPTPAQEAAAQFLFAARSSGKAGPRIPADIRPTEVADALAVALRVGELIGQTVGGWKCSVPTGPRPVACAAIFAPTIVRNSPCRVVADGDTAKIEPEIAFVLARDLPARPTPYSEEEVRGALREARFVLELVGSRYADPTAATFPELLADSISNRGLFVGPVISDAFERPLEAFPVAMRHGNETLMAWDGKHPDGHPLRPLYWLANYLAQRGDPLRAGMIVTTGSYCGVVDAPLDVPLTVVYGDHGELSVTLTS
jgi:2-keto-4-pentenoate hydratase